MSLTFDPVEHAYTWEGKRVPSVTQLLDCLHSFAGVPVDVLEAAQHRGSYVHAMCELYDGGELDEEANARVSDGAFVGYLEAWKRFLHDYEPNWSGIERRGYSRLYGFAGTMDRDGVLARVRPGAHVIDIKTAEQSHRVWGLQTAAYRQILMELDPSHAFDQRATVQLAKDGNYRFTPWTDPADWPTFQALITLDNWSRQ